MSKKEERKNFVFLMEMRVTWKFEMRRRTYVQQQEKKEEKLFELLNYHIEIN